MHTPHPPFLARLANCLVACLLSSAALCQSATADSLFAGFGNMHLGDPQSQYASDLVMINGVDTTKPEYAPYYFGYRGVKPAATTPEVIPFRNFMLGFSPQHVLVLINFSQIYTRKPSQAGFPLYKQYPKDLQKILDHFTGKLQRPPQKIVKYQKDSFSHINYVWETTSAKLTIDIQPDTKRKFSSINLYLESK